MNATVGTVDSDEIARFSAMAAEWWDPAGKFRPLHKFNPVRLAYIRDTVCHRHGRDPETARALEGVSVLDIGCGGGLLAEPIARMGADVLGVDASERNVKTAAAHAAETGTDVTYRVATAEALAAEGRTFDVVLAMEILEHVADVDLFLKSCAALLKPHGLLFFATLNRTPKSYLLGIVGAEYILRWLPPGTHDWRRFLRPSEIAQGVRAHGLTVKDLTGMTYNPFSDSFRLNAKDLDVNYLGWAEKA